MKFQISNLKFQIDTGPAPRSRGGFAALRDSAGFTLIEMLVAIFATGIIFTLLTAVFVQLLNIQRRAFSMEHTQENASFILESIAKEVRVAQIDTSGRTAGECYGDLAITHPNNGAVRYALSGGNFIRTNAGVDQTLNSSNASVERLSFCYGDPTQPRVTIIMRLTSGVGSGLASTDVQTTLAQRYFSP